MYIALAHSNKENILDLVSSANKFFLRAIMIILSVCRGRSRHSVIRNLFDNSLQIYIMLSFFLQLFFRSIKYWVYSPTLLIVKVF